MPKAPPRFSFGKPAGTGKAWDHGKRESRHVRGYGWQWEKLRAEVLRRDKYLCQTCLRQNRPTSAREVDHIKPKAAGGTDDLTNLEAICTPCHREKSARDKGHTPRRRKQAYGPDGWPIGKD